MRILKALLGLLLILLGILLGVYVGVWVCFIGGIVGIVKVALDLIHGFSLNGLALGLSILKFVFSGVAGYIAAVILIIPGEEILRRS